MTENSYFAANSSCVAVAVAVAGPADPKREVLYASRDIEAWHIMPA